MIISKCPLRVSLVGGSTDLQSVIDAYGYGGVISFPCNLYTYITLCKRYDGVYHINYSKTETVKSYNDIQNNIAREVLRYFNIPPVTVTFNCDISSTGSGLATSSSYTISLVKAATTFLNIDLSQHEICTIALSIEKKFNPLTGYQDTYGCGIGSFKKLEFKLKGSEVVVAYNYLPVDVLKSKSMYLVPTNVTRSSTNILSTLDITKSILLYDDVVQLSQHIKDESKFFNIVNRAWEKKKETSSSIISTDLDEIEQALRSRYKIEGLKLCGAGGGGYFLVFSEDSIIEGQKIDIDDKGVMSWVI